MNRDIFCGIVLTFVSIAIANTLSGVLALLIIKLNFNVLLFPIIMTIYYLLIIFLVCFKIKKIKLIKPWPFLLALLLFFIPKDFFFSYNLDELKMMENFKITIIDNAMKGIFLAIFASLSYIKYLKSAR